MKNRFFYILAFLISSLAFGQTPTAKSVKFLPQTSNISSPSTGQLFFLDTDKTYYYWDATQWQPLISNQNNTNKVVSYSTFGTISESTVATAINGLPLFTVSETQNLYILATQRSLITTNGDEDQTFVYVLKDLGKGNYGLGSGTTLVASDFIYISNIDINANTISIDQETQFINLGDVGSNDIVTAFNSHLFTGSEDPVQNQSEGYVLINVTINGQQLQYLFVGDGGNYGTGGTETSTNPDFVLLTDLNALQDTQFIEIGEIGNTSIETAFNSHLFTGSENPVQNQSEGYVIVNTLVEGVKVQYLFVGTGGNYGTGGTETAIENDFVIYAPYVTPRTNYTWTIGGTQFTNTGVPSYNNNGKIVHDGEVQFTKGWAQGGTNYGFGNTDTNWLYVNGNQGLILRASNSNNGYVRITSLTDFTVVQNNQTRYTSLIGRNYNEGLAHNDFKAIGVAINDVVDISNSTGLSWYAALRINPTLSGTGKHYSILSERGDIEFKNGSITFNDYTFPTSDGLSNQVLQTDGAGNLSWSNVTGGSGSKTITADTAASIDLSNPLGNECNYLSANANTTFTTTGTGGWATVLVNAASEPTVTGGTKEIGGTFIANTDIYLVVQHTSDGVKYFWNYKEVGSTSNVATRTGNTITFDTPAEYNAVTPATSGNITLDNTGAIAGVRQAFYFNGPIEPSISGMTIQIRSGLFSEDRLNVYYFEYNTNGQVTLTIQTDNTPQLIAPQNFIVSVVSGTELDINWDASVNATNYILERDTNSDFSSATQIYSGPLLTYSDTGLTTSTTYYYRVKAQATNFVDSVYSSGSGIPVAANYTLVGLVESPTGTFEAQAASNYANNYGVDATNAQAGTFTFTASLDNTTVNPEGMMFGVSSSSTNSAWNVGNWNAGAYIANGTLAIMKIVNGVATTTGSTAVLTPGNTLKITRDGSNNVKLLYNDVQIHDFGTITGNLYYHISAYTNKYIIID